MWRIYDLTEIQAWNECLDKIGNVDIHYYPQYLAPFELHGDGAARLFYYESQLGTAYMAYHLRDLADIAILANQIPQHQIYDIITPYGYGGMQINSNYDRFVNEVYEAFDEYCRAQGIIFEFVRFHPIYENYLACRDKYHIYRERKTICMELLHGSDAVWAGLTDKNRNMIRKAIKNGVIIKSGPISEYIDDFKRVYYQTMQRNDAGRYYYFNECFFSLCIELQEFCSRIFVAEYHEKIVSASIVLFKNQMMHYHLSGTETGAMQVAPNNLILWEAAKWGCENSFEVFHLGGGSTTEDSDSLYRFKSSFCKAGNTIAIQGYRIINQELYEQMVDLIAQSDLVLKVQSNSDFMPLYRV